MLFQITPKGGKSWLLRTWVGGKRREFGLGSYPEISLGEARTRAREAKDMIRRGEDPSVARKAAKRAMYQQSLLWKTFAQAVDEYTPIKQAELAENRYRNQWSESIHKHALPMLGSKLVNEISIDDILAVLKPIWFSKTATADKLRRKLKAVFDYCIGQGYLEGDNPAEWGGRLKMALPAPSKISGAENYPAVQLQDLGRFWRALERREGNSAAALRFQILTATRSGAIRFMTWGELSDDLTIWAVQPGRTSSKIPKSGNPRKVLLSPMAIEILKSMPKKKDCPYVFWSPTGKAFSDASLGSVMKKIHDEDVRQGNTGFLDGRTGKRAVPHGFRSTFKDWSLEIGNFDTNLSEMSLWHNVGSRVEQAYARTELIGQRRRIMDEWAEYVSKEGVEAVPA